MSGGKEERWWTPHATKNEICGNDGRRYRTKRNLTYPYSVEDWGKAFHYKKNRYWLWLSFPLHSSCRPHRVISVTNPFPDTTLCLDIREWNMRHRTLATIHLHRAVNLNFNILLPWLWPAAGDTMSGKSTWMKQLLLSDLITPPPNRIICLKWWKPLSTTCIMQILIKKGKGKQNHELKQSVSDSLQESTRSTADCDSGSPNQTLDIPKSYLKLI